MLEAGGAMAMGMASGVLAGELTGSMLAVIPAAMAGGSVGAAIARIGTRRVLGSPMEYAVVFSYDGALGAAGHFIVGPMLFG